MTFELFILAVLVLSGVVVITHLFILLFKIGNVLAEIDEFQSNRKH